MHESDRVLRQIGFSNRFQWLFGKPYLLSEEYRSGQTHTRKPRRPPTHPRFGKAGPSAVPMQKPTPMPTQPPNQYVSSYFGAYAMFCLDKTMIMEVFASPLA
ncbi:hypothetical protein PVK06_024687 [Gossypium arboreum]|uniref:Uncharacterized protein n=1 Tax=Gossypium arboreum TaxID=29729 RepID=A0ABR0PEU0_GOSAR|nr:hypothetical protein PVK06_024687 [Gossypium arboreum]